MRSAELATLAGVTVRTLRHYHQVGVLDEPRRSANGYRSYDVHDLIRVLRIRRLANLGLSLDQMPDLLDAPEPGGEASGVLDRLDAELEAQVERLTAQRRLVADLRARSVPPDLPPELAGFLPSPGPEVPADLARLDREQTVLLAHLVGPQGLPRLVDFYGRLGHRDLAPVLAGLSARFARLDDGTTPDEVGGLVDAFAEAFAPVLLAVGDTATDLDPSAERLVAEYTESVLNPAQQEVLRRIGHALDGAARPGDAAAGS